MEQKALQIGAAVLMLALLLRLASTWEWGQKELHPFSANADILHTSLLRTGGKDTKWRIRRDGRYRITVNILKETVKAEYLGE